MKEFLKDWSDIVFGNASKFEEVFCNKGELVNAWWNEETMRVLFVINDDSIINTVEIEKWLEFLKENNLN